MDGSRKMSQRCELFPRQCLKGQSSSCELRTSSLCPEVKIWIWPPGILICSSAISWQIQSLFSFPSLLYGKDIGPVLLYSLVSGAEPGVPSLSKSVGLSEGWSCDLLAVNGGYTRSWLSFLSALSGLAFLQLHNARSVLTSCFHKFCSQARIRRTKFKWA